jgi:putative phosphoserine phosphatase / 1-acylglycerol-3-phosphate O-acyltransferase
MIAAVFDLDRTLLPGTTAERIFLRHLLRHRVLGSGAASHTVRYAIDSGLSDIILRVRADRPYLIGMHDATLRLHGRRCAIDEILPALSQRGLDFLHWHQDRDHHPVLLSGSLPYVVEPLARELGIDDVICSQLDVKSQRVTGKLKELHPYGIAKATLILEYGHAHDVEFQASYCYADHHTDESLLQLFGHPVCVNPSRQLRAIGKEHGWRIEEFD